MTTGTAGHDARLRDLEAQAFRTGRTLAEHSEQLTAIRQQHIPPANISFPGNATGTPGERASTEHLLLALTRAQGTNSQTRAEPAPLADYLNNPFGST